MLLRQRESKRRFRAAVLLFSGLLLALAAVRLDTRAQQPQLHYTIQQYSPDGWYTGIQLIDMTADGVPEVLIGNRYHTSLEIWQYDPVVSRLVKIDDIVFWSHIHDVRAADFDKDGDMDLVVGLRFEGLYYATNTGQPGSVGSWDIEQLDPEYVWQVMVVDFDQDGNADIYDGVDYGPIHIFYGDGHGRFARGHEVSDPVTDMRLPRGFDATDLDNDGDFDLIGVDGSFLRAFLNPGNRDDPWASVGPSDPIGHYPCCDSLWLQGNHSPAAGDVDGNGYVDKVAILGTPDWPDPLKLLLFRGGADGETLQWTAEILDVITEVSWAGDVGMADLNGDAHPDIYLGGHDRFNGLRVYLGDGQGNFQMEIVPFDHGTSDFNSIAVGDLNSDGMADIVTGRYGPGDRPTGFDVLFRYEQEPLQALPDSYVTRLNTMVRAPAPGLLANDGPATGTTLQAVRITAPLHGWLNMEVDGSFAYFPDYGYTGEDSFTYKVTDGVRESAPATVTIYVWPNPHQFRLMALFR